MRHRQMIFEQAYFTPMGGLDTQIKEGEHEIGTGTGTASSIPIIEVHAFITSSSSVMSFVSEPMNTTSTGSTKI